MSTSPQHSYEVLEQSKPTVRRSSQQERYYETVESSNISLASMAPKGHETGTKISHGPQQHGYEIVESCNTSPVSKGYERDTKRSHGPQQHGYEIVESCDTSPRGADKKVNVYDTPDDFFLSGTIGTRWKQQQQHQLPSLSFRTNTRPGVSTQQPNHHTPQIPEAINEGGGHDYHTLESKIDSKEHRLYHTLEANIDSKDSKDHLYHTLEANIDPRDNKVTNCNYSKVNKRRNYN